MPFEKFTETTSEITRRPETEKPSFDFDKRIEPIKHAVEKVEEGFNPDKRISVEKIKNTISDVKEKFSDVHYYSTYEERFKQTPVNGEYIKGKRGEGIFVPNNAEVRKEIQKFDKEGVEYKDANPNFRPFAESVVKIDKMTGNMFSFIDDKTQKRVEGNFEQTDAACAEKWNKEAKEGKTDWTRLDVQKWRQEHKYSWHEEVDMKTMDLIPTVIHKNCSHWGGRAECNKRDAVKSRKIFGGFDA